MRVVIQRVAYATVSVAGVKVSEITKGMLVLVGIEDSDSPEDISWLAKKIVQLRIFDDEEGVMNRSVTEINGEIMIVSQFTLHASTRKGNRPSYIRAARPGKAIPIYDQFIMETESLLGRNVSTGRFGAMMDIELLNDGPVTIIMDTKNKDF